METTGLTVLSQEELSAISGGSPKEWLHQLGDWIAYGIGWAIAMEGAMVASSTLNGGNAAAVVAFK